MAVSEPSLLSETAIHNLAAYVAEGLSVATVALPSSASPDMEYSFTSHWVRPTVESLVRGWEDKGLLVAGDGGAPVAPLPLLGLLFTPDVTIRFHEQRLIAIEVKLLRPSATQTPLKTGIGQAAIYREAGFPVSLLVALDAGGLGRGDLRADVAGIGVLVRQVPLEVPPSREDGD